MTPDDFLIRLERVRQRGTGKWSALCPAHSDNSPSLSIHEGDRGLLLRCFAGCRLEEICASLGIEQKDLFYDRGLPRGQRSAPKPPRINRIALAFRFELGALDHRIRAERIIETVRGIDLSTVSDEELDCVLSHIGRAYDDQECAALFEHVADTLRERDFTERTLRERKTCAA